MKIILASGSPRRKQILTEAGFEFEVLKLDVDESFPADMPVADVPLFLAKKKMQEAKQHVQENAIIITADTVVILHETIINKPIDSEDAKNILRKLSGTMHEVISGVCILKDQKEIYIESLTKVFMHALTEEEITFYISTYKPFDKAGAYAIQEWIGLNKIYKIEGDYYNVVGFPMSDIYSILHNS
ncbi:MAG: septum formation protein Maf [Fimbriimonadaceae bacterium]|nr:septum formation protein Maf [Chitinophagales bacterium]